MSETVLLARTRVPGAGVARTPAAATSSFRFAGPATAVPGVVLR